MAGSRKASKSPRRRSASPSNRSRSASPKSSNKSKSPSKRSKSRSRSRSRSGSRSKSSTRVSKRKQVTKASKKGTKKGSSSSTQKKHHKRNYGGFGVSLRRMVAKKSTLSHLRWSQLGSQVAQDLIRDLAVELTESANALLHTTKAKTLGIREFEFALRQLVSIQDVNFLDQVTKKASDSVRAFVNSKEKALEAKKSGAKRLTSTERAGLTLMVTRIQKVIRQFSTVKRLQLKAAVFLTSVIENIMYMVLGKAEKIITAKKMRTIFAPDISRAIQSDLALSKIFSASGIASGGAVLDIEAAAALADGGRKKKSTSATSSLSSSPKKSKRSRKSRKSTTKKTSSKKKSSSKGKKRSSKKRSTKRKSSKSKKRQGKSKK